MRPRNLCGYPNSLDGASHPGSKVCVNFCPWNVLESGHSAMALCDDESFFLTCYPEPYRCGFLSVQLCRLQTNRWLGDACEGIFSVTVSCTTQFCFETVCGFPRAQWTMVGFNDSRVNLKTFLLVQQIHTLFGMIVARTFASQQFRQHENSSIL